MPKAKSTPPVPFPPVFFPTDEADPFLAKYKAALAKRLSLSRMQDLYDEVDLAIYLLALGRDAEALAVASFLPAQIAFTGNHNVWAPTADAIVTAVYLLRRSGREAEAEALLARLREAPAHANRDPAYYRDMVEGFIPKELEKGWADPSKKWACQQLARTVTRAIFWRETNLPGFHHHGFYERSALDGAIALGLQRLRTRMTG